MQYSHLKQGCILLLLVALSLLLTACFHESVPSNRAPVAKAKASATEVEVSQSVNFDASDSYDPDGKLISYAWDFGDGNTATGVTTKHAYNSSGTYHVSLTVIDNKGATDQDSLTIQVKEPPKPACAGIGQATDNRQLRLTLNGVSTTEQISIWTPDKEGDHYVITDVTLVALTDDQYVNPLRFILVEEDGTGHDASIATYALNDYLISRTLNNGDKAKGKVAFEAPKAAKKFKLIYRAFLDSDLAVCFEI